jgi:dolichyl-phosphate beta-glucosyltransferase
MKAKPYLSVIVPAFNEANSIMHTLAAMHDFFVDRSYTYEIIVSADGNDGTRKLVADVAARDSRLQVIGRVERGGKGRAIREGVKRARGEIIGFVDADYKTPIEEIDKLLPWLHRGYDLSIGSRAVADSRIEVRQPVVRRLGSNAFALAMHLVIGLWNVRDTQCGFKFFRAAVARDLFARQRINGYMFDIEVLYLAQIAGYRLKEVGIRWRDDGDSRLRLIAGNWRNFVDILRIRLNRQQHVECASALSPGEHSWERLNAAA